MCRKIGGLRIGHEMVHRLRSQFGIPLDECRMEPGQPVDHDLPGLAVRERSQAHGLHVVDEAPDGVRQTLVPDATQPGLSKCHVGQSHLFVVVLDRRLSCPLEGQCQLLLRGRVHVGRDAGDRCGLEQAAHFEDVAHIVDAQRRHHEATARADQIALIHQAQQCVACRHARGAVGSSHLDVDQPLFGLQRRMLQALAQFVVDAVAQCLCPCQRLGGSDLRHWLFH